MSALLLRDVEVDGQSGLDVILRDGTITQVGVRLRSDAPALEGRGGALLPGLHDHHIHVLALAAREGSVPCGPPEVHDLADLSDALRRAPGDGWIRGAGWDDTLLGWLDADALDRILDDRPVRLQHRSGHLWVVNRLAITILRLEDEAVEGIEREAAGRPTGRLYDLDAWLRARLAPARAPDIRRLGDRLASWGVTGITDATPTNGRADAEALRGLPQRVSLLGGADLSSAPRKLVLTERSLPAPTELAADIDDAHGRGRPVAIHAASREALVVALAALEEAGTVDGDRVEHASVAPPELVEWLARLRVRVVTQPGFLAAHGGRYATTVEADDRPWLYRGRGFLDAGVRLAAGSDAPFGPADPWVCIRAAVTRQADDGHLLGGTECLTPEEALALFTSPADRPGDPPRRVAPGEAADLCLLRLPWSASRCRLTSDLVAATLVAGEVVLGTDR